MEKTVFDIDGYESFEEFSNEKGYGSNNFYYFFISPEYWEEADLAEYTELRERAYFKRLSEENPELEYRLTYKITALMNIKNFITGIYPYVSEKNFDKERGHALREVDKQLRDQDEDLYCAYKLLREYGAPHQELVR